MSTQKHRKPTRRSDRNRPAVIQPLEQRQLLTAMTFNIVPELSQLTADGFVGSDVGFNGIDTATYNNPATYSGTIQADVGATTISFPGGSNIIAASGSTAVQPGNAAANYNFLTHLVDDISLAYRDLHLDVNGTTSLSGTSFDTGDLVGKFTNGHVDYSLNSTVLNVTLINADSILGTGAATVVRANGFLTLTIPVDAEFQVSLDGTSIGSSDFRDFFDLTGTIVARASLGPVEFISGTVANDLNDNGTRDTSEPGLSRRTVYLDLNNNGRMDALEPSSTTDKNGKYRIPDLDAGTYRVRLLREEGFRSTTGDTGYTVTVSANHSSTNRNFLLTQKARLGGSVFYDSNGDGKRQKAEGTDNVSNLIVYLDNNNNGELDENEPVANVGTNGEYLFTNLTAGEKIVRLQLSPSYTLTTSNQGAAASLSVGGSARADRIGVAITAVTYGTIIDDFGGTAVPGVVVYIDRNNDGKLDKHDVKTVTDESGNWRFDGLALERHYVVRIVVPKAFIVVGGSTVIDVDTFGDTQFGTPTVYLDKIVTPTPD